MMQEWFAASSCGIKSTGMMLVQAEHLLGADPRVVCALRVRCAQCQLRRVPARDAWRAVHQPQVPGTAIQPRRYHLHSHTRSLTVARIQHKARRCMFWPAVLLTCCSLPRKKGLEKCLRLTLVVELLPSCMGALAGEIGCDLTFEPLMWCKFGCSPCRLGWGSSGSK